MSKLTKEQQKILDNDKKNLIVSASAGSGKTFVVIEYLIKLICQQKVPISRMLVLTFTKAAAGEMKTRLTKAILEQKIDDFLIEQLDDISISDISTIDAFCEKLLKRNINKVELDDNFIILDDKTSKNLKFLSFNHVFNRLAQEKKNLFDDLYFAFKKNKEQIFNIITSMQNFFDSQQDSENLLNNLAEKDGEYLIASYNFLNNLIFQNMKKVKDKLLVLNTDNVHDAYKSFKENLLSFCNIPLSENYENFFDNCAKINSYVFASLPRNKIDDDDLKAQLVQCRDYEKEIQKLTMQYEYINQNLLNNILENGISKGLILLYKEYKKEYDYQKNIKRGVDFADLEKYAKLLLQDEEVKKELQNRYDYIFIDEYQDTNTLQESIIKPIADGGKFIAVGDPKQGIYGFRNASMEIMTNDIKQFSSSDDGQALYLTGNFRSDDRLLQFVNNIFEKIMTIESVGIDYKNTSMLKGLSNFESNKNPAVTLDIVLPKEEEKEEKQGLYSVKEDNITFSRKYENEVKDICLKVEKYLQSEIYDSKKRKWRKVQENDIAILFRERNQIMQECVRYMQEKGYNIVADIKQALLDDAQLQVILSILKLTLNLDDDISLVSVMNSWFGGFELDELIKIRENNQNSSFYEAIKNISQTDKKVNNFLKMIEDFSFECKILGVTKALQNLFVKTDYNLYLSSLPSANIKNSHINELFKIIKSGEYEFNLQGLINYLNSVKTEGTMIESSSNAITITTIHATKGLEYPIVILAGCGERLGKSNRSSYNISKKFGIGTFVYDFDENIRIPSPIYLANKYSNKRKDFVDEIMIFYVALTRAQNHLILIGTAQEKDIDIKEDIFECSCYYELIFSALGQNFFNQLFSQGKIKTANYEFNVVEEVKEQISDKLKLNIIDFEKLKENYNELNKYVSFVYNDYNDCFYEYKNSVSGLLDKENEDYNEHQILNVNNNQEILKVSSRDEAIKRGNAYHEALKVLDFNKINDRKDLEKNKEYLIQNLGDEYYSLIDFDLLYNNISLIKKIVGDGKIFKERQFIMKTNLKEAGISESLKDIIVQGICDLFSIGKQNILIDYKFTSEKDINKVRQRYEKQIYLYSLAIEKGYNIKINKRFLLSLKYGQIIEI